MKPVLTKDGNNDSLNSLGVDTNIDNNRQVTMEENTTLNMLQDFKELQQKSHRELDDLF